ncbi:glycosyltransferase family 4 protein [Pseudomonas guariconensis]|uniref:glycosyltransferase family 4 protein n=1 Tax=Pseudomonas guariconensis TaxID=1288410 RepID=UPI0018A8B9E8|nr:glycosyltransferase family 4 protein [Pseudomonas guariconensis]MBF8756127.1 glycosyltransferase family 4 protein [Pseudomonas guariconensis]
MKQARALVSQGNRVRIYGRNHDDFPTKEVVDGIEIVRLPVLDHNLATLCDINILDFPESQNVLPEALKNDLRSRFKKMVQARDELEKTKKLATDYKNINLAAIEQIPLLTEKRNRLIKSIWKQERDAPKTLSRAIKNKIKSWLKYKNRKKLELEKTNRELTLLAEARDEAKRQYHDREKSHPRKEYTEKLREEIFYCRHLLFASKLLAFDHDITPDVIHSHDLYPLLGAVLLGKKTGAKVIFDAHEIETERVPPLPPERKNFIDVLERGLLNHSDHVITCCESSTEFYHQRFNRRKPVVVMNAPDYNDESIESIVDIRELAGISTDTPTVIYTGGVGQEARGMDKAILALKLLSGVHLAILGPRHAKNDQWLLEKAEEAGVSERVHFIPSVPADLVVPTIKSADVGICLIQDVSLSYRYAMPNKLFEMTFAEVPIVVSDLPEMGRFITELKNGIVVDQTDPCDIARGIQSVLDNREKYQVGDNSRKTLRTIYSWKAQSAALAKAYKEVLEEEHV